MKLVKLGAGAAAVALVVGGTGAALLGSGVASADEPGGRGGIIRQRAGNMLAEKLGVTAEAWAAADQTTRNQIIDAALAEGRISEEEATRLKRMTAVMERIRDGDGPRRERRNAQPSQTTPRSRPGPQQYTPPTQGRGPIFQIPQELRRAAFNELENLMGTLSAALHMSPEDIRAALANGQTLNDLARQQNVDPGQLRNTIVTQVKADIARALTDRGLSQQQANNLLNSLEQRIQSLLQQRGLNLR